MYVYFTPERIRIHFQNVKCVFDVYFMRTTFYIYYIYIIS